MSCGVKRERADLAKCGFDETKWVPSEKRFVKLQAPPPEIRILFPMVPVCSSRTTDRPRFPHSTAQKRPAAPAPMITTSFFMTAIIPILPWELGSSPVEICYPDLLWLGV